VHGVHHLPIAKPPAPTGHAEPLERLIQVGDLARETGKTVRALHLYEELGLLKPHARSKGKFRLYGRDALVRVRWIAKLQEMGLSLAEITELVRQWESSESATDAMTKVREVFESRLRQTRAQLARLRELEGELEASLAYLDVCEASDPARVVRQCTGCDLHTCDHPAPELVRGVQAPG
jgi:DNA-binding transcriptional MerR regulator